MTAQADAPVVERPIVEVEGLNLHYGEAQALFGIDLQVPEYQVTALIGPSGCGKSTLLRCMNRLNDLIDSVRIEGRVRIAGEDIYGPGYDVISLRRPGWDGVPEVEPVSEVDL